MKVPAGVTQVTVRARHKPKGYDGEAMRDWLLALVQHFDAAEPIE